MPTLLRRIYVETLARCAPERMVRQWCAKQPPAGPVVVVAIGKCAAGMLAGFSAGREVLSAFCAVPAGYPGPEPLPFPLEVAEGGHPRLTPSSFEAGRKLLAFAESIPAGTEVVALVSGGGSACVESPRPPFTEDDLVAANDALLASGMDIHSMNVVRRQLSALKNGGLAARICGNVTTLVYSDVAPGAVADVASGPTLRDDSTPAAAASLLRALRDRRTDSIAERLDAAPSPAPEIEPAVHLIAESATLVAMGAIVAGERGVITTADIRPYDVDVETAAVRLADAAADMRRGEVHVCGGEPTVVRRGDGRGGRCSELAVRFALELRRRGLTGISALFGSSDGVDGTSGVAGFEIPEGAVLPPDEVVREALERSDSLTIAEAAGEPIMIPPTGNNLRDLFLLAHS